MLWLGVYFPDLPLEVFALRDAGGWDLHSPVGAISRSRCLPELRLEDRSHEEKDRDLEIAPTRNHKDIPRIVVENNHVILGNAAAAAIGIAPGSSLATAHSIVPGLVHYRRSRGQESTRLRQLAEALYRFSSQVALIPPSGVVLEIGASLRLFGGVERLAAEATAVCEMLGHATSCRTAATPLAALTLARAGTPMLAEVPLRLAALEPEPLAPTVIEQLGNMGIQTLGQLLDLPAAGLAMRFGPSLVDYLQRLTGDQPDVRPHLQPSPQFRRRVHLLSAVCDKAVLLIPMTQLLTELQHWLVAHQLGVERLLWRFAGAGRNVRPVSMPVQFSTGQQRAARLLEINRLELERTALPEEVIDIGLGATRVRPWQTGSQALFRYLAPGMPSGAASRSDRGERGSRNTTVIRGRASRSSVKSARLNAGQLAELGELVDRLEARLGRGACWSLEVRDQHLPEDAWQRVTPIRAGRASSSSRPPLPADVASADAASAIRNPGRSLRPAWLFVPPRRVRSEQLTLLRGPERIESGWWRGGDEDAVGAISRSRSGLLAMRTGDRSYEEKDRESPLWERSPDRDAFPDRDLEIAPTKKTSSPIVQSLTRDYYVARLENGAECWVFRDAAGDWYLHGYFG